MTQFPFAAARNVVTNGSLAATHAENRTNDGQSPAGGPHAALGFLLCGPLTAGMDIRCAALSKVNTLPIES